jgi:hypothetical protein
VSETDTKDFEIPGIEKSTSVTSSEFGDIVSMSIAIVAISNHLHETHSHLSTLGVRRLSPLGASEDSGSGFIAPKYDGEMETQGKRARKSGWIGFQSYGLSGWYQKNLGEIQYEYSVGNRCTAVINSTPTMSFAFS